MAEAHTERGRVLLVSSRLLPGSRTSLANFTRFVAFSSPLCCCTLARISLRISFDGARHTSDFAYALGIKANQNLRRPKSGRLVQTRAAQIHDVASHKRPEGRACAPLSRNGLKPQLYYNRSISPGPRVSPYCRTICAIVAETSSNPANNLLLTVRLHSRVSQAGAHI